MNNISHTPELPDQAPIQDIDLAQHNSLEDNESSNGRKWAGRLAAGALVAGGAAALISNPIGHLDQEVVKHGIEESVPFVTAAAVTEALWLGGAGIALGAAGKKIRIRNIKSDFRKGTKDFADDVYTSPAFKFGVQANTVGALGTAAVIGVAAVTKLPPETWPGALGVASLDMAGTLALRAPLYKGMRERAKSAETNKVSVRWATFNDIDRLADIDLRGFRSAYGDNPPEKEAVKEMFTKRLQNTSWMFVAEMNGQIEGFVSAFRTDKSADDFKSWEDSTANGTLEGKVNPNGRYAYVTNMTINPKAVENGAKDMLLASLFAEAIREGGVEYGYFESRMPLFKHWLRSQGKLGTEGDELQTLAEEFAELRKPDGKRYDKQLAMYEADGFKLGKPVANAFEDDKSQNFGVVAVAPVPTYNKFFEAVKPARAVAGTALHLAAKNAKVIDKVFKYL